MLHSHLTDTIDDWLMSGHVIPWRYRCNLDNEWFTVPFNFDQGQYALALHHVMSSTATHTHDDFIKWKHFPRYWPFVLGHRWIPPTKGGRGALMFSLISAWINGRVNNRKACDLRRHRAHHDVIVMKHTLKCGALVYFAGLNKLLNMQSCWWSEVPWAITFMWHHCNVNKQGVNNAWIPTNVQYNACIFTSTNERA